MRPRTIGLLLAFWSGVVFLACSTSPNNSTSTTGTGGAPNCDGILFGAMEDAGHPCNVCVTQNCCAELAACSTEHCRECSVNGGGIDCASTKQIWNTLRTCASDFCQTDCWPPCFPGFCPDARDDG